MFSVRGKYMYIIEGVTSNDDVSTVTALRFKYLTRVRKKEKCSGNYDELNSNKLVLIVRA
jgi:hypothetical protein